MGVASAVIRGEEEDHWRSQRVARPFVVCSTGFASVVICQCRNPCLRIQRRDRITLMRDGEWAT
jgi:hypothetical protein